MAKKRVDIVVQEKGAKQTQSSFKKLGSSVAATAAGFIGVGVAISAVTRLFSSAIEKYKIQEAAEKKLQVALGKTSQSLLNQASALQKLTSFGDETIITVQASIAAFIKNEDQIKKATVATLDMASALGIDLKAAGDLVAKTLGSSTNALTRYGVTVKGAVGSTERLTTLTDGIAKLWGGQAAAQADTLAGRVDNLSNSFGDLLEQVGKLADDADRKGGFLSALASHIDGVTASLKRGTFWTVFTKAMAESNSVAQALSNTIASFTAEGLKPAIESQDNLNASGAAATTTLNDQQKAYNSFSKAQRKSSENSIQNRIFALEYNKTLWDQDAVLSKLIDTRNALSNLPPPENIIPLDSSAMKDLENMGPIELIPESAISRIFEASEALVLLQENFEPLGSAILEMGIQAEEGLESFAKTAINMVRRTLSAFLAETVAAAVKQAMASVPFPLNLIAAGVAGGAAAALFNSIVPKFAKGGDFVTSGPQVIMVGDNPGGRERVQVTPQSSANINGPSGVTINITGNVLTKDFVEDQVIPQIQAAVRRAG